jgi:ankyrin repeat protein
VVKFLASRGASLDVRNKAGLTPLDLASGAGGRGGRPGVVRESTVALLKQLMADAAARKGSAARN